MKSLYLGIILGLFLFSNIALADNLTAVYDSSATIKYINLIEGDWYMEDLVGITPDFNISYWQSARASTYPIYKATSVAQGISATTGDWNLSGVGLNMGTYFPQQFVEENINITMTLRENNAGNPTGAVLRTVVMTKDEWARAGTGGNIQYNFFIFNETITLTNNTLYWIRIDIDNWSGTATHNYFTIGYHNVDVYSGGRFVYSANDGSTWTLAPATYLEAQFLLMNTDGVSTYADFITEPTSQNYQMRQNFVLNPVGLGTLNLIAGDNIITNHSVAGSGYGLCSGCRFSGGLLNISGSPDNYVKLTTGGLRGAYGLIATDSSDIHTNVKANYFNENALVSNGGAYLSGTYSTFEFKNSIFNTTGYDASSTYALRLMYADRYAMFNNVSFVKGCGATCYQALYFYANVIDGNWRFVDCDILRNGTANTSTAIYNGNSLGYFSPTFINMTHRGVPLETTDIENVYQITGFTMGYSVYPTIIRTNGNPIENAVITLSPQFDDTRDLPEWFMGVKSSDPLYMNVYTYFPLYSVYDNKLTAITNADGKPLDADGNTILYMKDAFYYDTDEHKSAYYGGSNMSLRPNNYIWKNDGTDYGYILQITADGYEGKQIVIPSDQPYAETITLVSLVENTTESFCGWSIDTTDEFDNGTKSSSSGNYEIETWTDNLNISDGTIALSNKYSDRFTFDDADANTTKWTNYELAYGSSSTYNTNISDGKYNSEVVINIDGEYADQNLVLNSVITGDFDIQVDFSDYHYSNTSGGVWDGLVFGDTPDWTGSYAGGVYRVYDTYGMPQNKYVASNWADTWEEVETNDTDGKMRVVREGTMFSYYYWNNTGSDWVLLEEKDYATGDFDAYIYLYTTNYDDNAVSIAGLSFDDFKINSGTLIPTNNTTRTSGSWQSDTIAMTTGNMINQTMIDYMSPDTESCIDKIQWIVNSTVKAEMTTDICNSSGTRTIYDANLTNGTFNDINDDFSIKIFLKGNGTASPEIYNVYCSSSSAGGSNQMLFFMGDSTYSVISSNNTYFGFKNEKETFLEYIFRLLGKDLRTLIGIET